MPFSDTTAGIGAEQKCESQAYRPIEDETDVKLKIVIQISIRCATHNDNIAGTWQQDTNSKVLHE